MIGRGMSSYHRERAEPLDIKNSCTFSNNDLLRSVSSFFAPTMVNPMQNVLMQDAEKPHGGDIGHVLPGTFFFVWGSWWLLNTLRDYSFSTPPNKLFRSKPWFLQPFLRELPLEPILKVFCTFIGINGELWAGHPSWR
jgi:hypothetical protein